MTSKFSRRSLRLGVCFIILMSVVVAACGAPAPAPTPTPTEPQTLNVYSFDAAPVNQVLDIVTRAFNDAHPNVTVHTEPIRGDPTRIITNTATNAPDVILTIDSMTPSLVGAGLLLDMRELANIDPTFKPDDIITNALAAGAVRNDPGLYMVPAVMESVQMFYNKDLFKKSGAPFPVDNWTWDDLIAACGQIQDANPDVKCLGYNIPGLPDPSWWGYLVPWILGYGGDVLSPDGKTSTLSTPEALAGIQAYADLWVKHQVAADPTTRGNCFVTQRCAVVFSIAGTISGYQKQIGSKFDWDAQLMPAFPKGRFTGTGIYGLGIARSTHAPSLAWEYVKLLASAQVQQSILANRAGMPVLKSLAADASFGSGGPPANMQAFIKGIDYGVYPRAYPTACGNFYVGTVQSAISDGFRAVLSGADADTTFKAADAQIQACLDAANQ